MYMHSIIKSFILIQVICFYAQNDFAQHPVFRWDVKTLTDNSGIDWQAKLESAHHARLASIEGLTKKDIQFKSCHDVGHNTRRTDELRVVKLKVRLWEVKREPDNDYHVVLQSLTDSRNTMVAEIPDPEDEELQGSEFAGLRSKFEELRSFIDSSLNAHVTGTPKKFPADIIVTIYGVPFWDCKHPIGVGGASKDFREIHPVLEIDE
jgi:hypothetical protein